MADRKVTVSKDLFLKNLAAVLKAKGVCFKNGSRVSTSQAAYWELYTLIKDFEVAIAAASGNSVSLAGIGKFAFKEAGRDDKRSYRFKAVSSSRYGKFFAENQDLVVHGDQTEESVAEKTLEILSAINKGIAVGKVEDTEVDEEVIVDEADDITEASDADILGGDI